MLEICEVVGGITIILGFCFGVTSIFFLARTGLRMAHHDAEEAETKRGFHLYKREA